MSTYTVLVYITSGFGPLPSPLICNVIREHYMVMMKYKERATHTIEMRCVLWMLLVPARPYTIDTKTVL